MQVLTFRKACVINVLYDELLSQMPGLRPVDDMSVFTLYGDEYETTLQVPDNLSADDVALIEQVVMNHDYDAARREEALQRIRVERNKLLLDTDWTQLPDVPMDADTREAWRLYRQKLRDFPATCDPFNPVWPEPPGTRDAST